MDFPASHGANYQRRTSLVLSPLIPLCPRWCQCEVPVFDVKPSFLERPGRWIRAAPEKILIKWANRCYWDGFQPSQWNSLGVHEFRLDSTHSLPWYIPTIAMICPWYLGDSQFPPENWDSNGISPGWGGPAGTAHRSFQRICCSAWLTPCWWPWRLNFTTSKNGKTRGKTMENGGLAMENHHVEWPNQRTWLASPFPMPQTATAYR